MSKNQTSSGRGLDNRIPPPIVFFVTALAMGVAAFLLPPSGLGGPWTWVLGSGLVLIAGLFGPSAIQRFRKAGTTISPV